MKCEVCGRGGEIRRSEKDGGLMICAWCHHGGPQKVTPIRQPAKPIGGKKIKL
jgi:hypothetical protein